MNMGVENGDFNGGHFYMNSPTVPKSNNHNFIDSTNKRDQISPSISEMEKMDYRMVLKFMLCKLYPHLINMTIWNTIITS